MFFRSIGNKQHRIKNPAAKAYLWLLIRQEETSRNTGAKFSATDAQLAQGLGVSKTTAAKYREQLQQKPELLKRAIKEVGKVVEIRTKKEKY
jgi:CTP-dependent riboflavin kinase